MLYNKNRKRTVIQLLVYISGVKILIARLSVQLHGQ